MRTSACSFEVPFRVRVGLAATLLALAGMASGAPQPAASELPAARDALLAQAQGQRDARDWPLALHSFRLGRERYPQDLAFQWGEIQTLADGGQSAEAVALAQQLLERRPDDPDTLLVMGYAQLRHAGVYASLEYVDRAMQHAGERPYVVREYLLALQRAHLADAALEIARQRPGLLSAQQQWELEADAAAENVRHAALPARGEAERFDAADRALARYDALLAQWRSAGNVPAALVQRVRIDRLQALHARSRMQELVDEYEALVAEGAEVPVYALGDVASAYLYLKQPQRAAALYRQLIAANYLRHEVSARQDQDFGLQYAYADQGEFEAARQSAHAVAAQQPPWRTLEGDKEATPNPAYLDARHMAAMMDFYAGDTPGAQRALERLVAAAPTRSHLRVDLATVYAARGWPRKAEIELKIAEAHDPRDVGLETAQGQVALDLQEWRQARELSADTLARYPENQRAQRLARQWRAHDSAELQLALSKGLGNDNPIAGGRDLGAEATLYSRPLAENWRLLAGLGQRRGNFSDGRAQHNFVRAGLEWRSRDWTVLGELAENHFSHGGRTGGGIGVNYQIDDAWSLQAGAQRLARDTPLQALRNNITSDRLDLGVRWRQSERRQWSFSASPSNFSDGNRRRSLLLSGQERLVTRPNWYLDAGVEIYATRNRRNDVAYYSPLSERSLLPSLRWNHTLRQDSARAWTQFAGIGLGGLTQQGYGGSALGVLSYGQRYRINDLFEVGGTLSAISRSYDGRREREWRIAFDLNQRF